MKIKNIQVIAVNRGIDALIALKLPLRVETNYKLAELSVAIVNPMTIIQKTKSQLLEKYGITKDTKTDANEFKIFLKEWSEVADIEIDIDVEPITLSELKINTEPGTPPIFVPIEIFRDLKPFVIK